MRTSRKFTFDSFLLVLLVTWLMYTVYKSFISGVWMGIMLATIAFIIVYTSTIGADFIEAVNWWRSRQPNMHYFSDFEKYRHAVRVWERERPALWPFTLARLIDSYWRFMIWFS